MEGRVGWGARRCAALGGGPLRAGEQDPTGCAATTAATAARGLSADAVSCCAALLTDSVEKISSSPMPAKQRENIDKFIAAARSFGVLDRENVRRHWHCKAVSARPTAHRVPRLFSAVQHQRSVRNVEHEAGHPWPERSRPCLSRNRWLRRAVALSRDRANSVGQPKREGEPPLRQLG